MLGPNQPQRSTNYEKMFAEVCRILQGNPVVSYLIFENCGRLGAVRCATHSLRLHAC